ncbi:BrnA antitoxin family protein [Chloroflexi bacterium TSY]|nr:BrnA antitoxin family protein [Chloroflexi bacterium TSY]
MNKNSKTDWARLEAMTDDEIDTSDISPLDDEFFAKGELRLPKNKPMISIRIDADVLDWFKAQGPGYQTRMNAVLRLYMEAQVRNQVPQTSAST